MSSSYITDSVVLLKPGYPPHLNITTQFSLGIITEEAGTAQQVFEWGG